MPLISEFVIISIIFLVITVILVLKRRYKLLKELINNKIFVVGIIMVTVFSAYTLNLDNKHEEIEKLQHATKQALLGLIIAVMGYLDLKIAPFWAIFLASYYLDV